jgi:energy coupling factor transporter S component ThiW
VLAGVLLGPSWAAAVALFVGIIRNIMGTGTIYAFPGGIPGGITVGLAYRLLRELNKTERTASIAALFEPVGTVLVGATLSLYLIAPIIGDVRLLSQLERNPLALIALWSGWAASSISGSAIGFAVLLILRKVGVTRETLFGEK